MLLATTIGVNANIPTAHADPGDVTLNGCTDPANQACFDPYTAVNLRNGPGTGYAREGPLYPGTVVSLCQVLGENINGNSIWDYVGNDPDAGTGLFVSRLLHEHADVRQQYRIPVSMIGLSVRQSDGAATMLPRGRRLPLHRNRMDPAEGPVVGGRDASSGSMEDLL